MNVFHLYVAGGQLTYTYPQVYDYNLPESFRKDNPNIAATIGSKHVKTPPWNQTIMLTSSAGQKFTSFAKYTNFNAGLWITYEHSYINIYCSNFYKLTG